MFSETDFQVTMLRNQELVTRGLQEQFVASVLPPSTSTPAVVTVLRQQCGALLLRAGQRLQSGHAVARESLSTVATTERGAIRLTSPVATYADAVCARVARSIRGPLLQPTAAGHG